MNMFEQARIWQKSALMDSVAKEHNKGRVKVVEGLLKEIDRLDRELASYQENTNETRVQRDSARVDINRQSG